MCWISWPFAIRLATLAAALSLLAACGRIDSPQQRGELVIAVSEAPGLFQPGTAEEKEISGFNFDTVEAFAAALGVPARYVKATDPQEMATLVRRGKVHMAASLPVATGSASFEGLLLSPELRTSKPVLVRHSDALGPDGLTALSGLSVEVVAGTPQAHSLRMLPEASRPQVIERNDSNDITLLEQLAGRASSLVASDSLSFDIATNYYPDLAIAAELPGEIKFVWAFAANADPALFDRATAFIEHIRKDGTLARISDRYFGHIRRVNPLSVARFLEHRQTLLPLFRRDFVAAQEITGIDWRLLAALAYQESQWDPLATSPTGVRGIMMLTEDTADRMKVSNRLDAAQSIRAGSLYLAGMIDQLPPGAVEPDRTWLALAAYNLGMGHLNGARQFAPGLKRDPNSWYDMKQVLPLLARPEYYSRLKSGRARGGEAVILVENVRTYFDILVRFEPALRFTLIPPFKRREAFPDHPSRVAARPAG